MKSAPTHYSKTSLNKKSTKQPIANKKNSFTRWLQRLFCIRDKNEISYTNGMDMSIYDESQQHTLRIVNNLHQFNEYFKIDHDIRVIKTIESKFPFVAQFDSKELSTLEDLYQQAIPNLQDKVVLLFSQNPPLQLIRLIESQANYIIIHSPTQNQEISMFQEKRIYETNKLNHSLSEFIYGKLPLKRNLNIIDYFIFIPDYSHEGKQYVDECLKQLYEQVPTKLDKVLLILNVSGCISQVLSLCGSLNEQFIEKFENEQWINRIQQLTANQGVIIKQKDQTKNKLEKSQFMNLSNSLSSNKIFNLKVDNTEFIINIIKFQQDQGVSLIIKCLLNQDHQQKSELSQLFCSQIFFYKDLKTLSQFDSEDNSILLKIIIESSFLSCCICIHQLKLNEIKELGSLKRKFKKYLEILILSGIILTDSESYNIQKLFKKYIEIPIYEVQIQKIGDSQNTSLSNTQQLIIDKQDNINCNGAASMEYNLASSEKESQFFLGLQELNQSELQLDK